MRLLAILLLVPAAGLAQTQPAPRVEAAEAAQPAAPAAQPLWSIGAGFTWTYVYAISGAVSLGFPASSAGVPVVNASLERRLSDRSWLSLGLSGAVYRRRMDAPPAGAFGMVRDDGGQIYLTAGIRQVLTGPQAPVDFSLLALAEVGYASADQGWVESTGVEASRDLTTWLLGASLGLAVDRELTPGLSVRVATPLLGVGYSWTRTVPDGGQPVEGSDLSARLIIAPRLELRLAF